MGIEEILGAKREEILRIAAKHGVTSIRVFGDVARGDAGPDSEIDFLIEAGAATTPWFRVHIAFANALPAYAEHIQQEAIAL